MEKITRNKHFLLSAALSVAFLLATGKSIGQQTKSGKQLWSNNVSEHNQFTGNKKQQLVATSTEPIPECGDLKYVANKFSGKFHLLYCEFALKMWRINRLPLARAKEARELGFRPCRFCLPVREKVVRAYMLNAGKAQIPAADSATSEKP